MAHLYRWLISGLVAISFSVALPARAQSDALLLQLVDIRCDGNADMLVTQYTRYVKVIQAVEEPNVPENQKMQARTYVWDKFDTHMEKYLYEFSSRNRISVRAQALLDGVTKRTVVRFVEIVTNDAITGRLRSPISVKRELLQACLY